jgi:hypothetical protein
LINSEAKGGSRQAVTEDLDTRLLKTGGDTRLMVVREMSAVLEFLLGVQGHAP